MKAAVITISDTRSAGRASDESGPAAQAALNSLGFDASHLVLVPDEANEIRALVQSLAGVFPLIVTSGGTGAGPRDVTPEAISPLFDKALPGFGEIMRVGSFEKTPMSIISRGGAGVIGQCLVVMLPGSPRGVCECLDLVGPAIKHLMKAIQGGGPCHAAPLPGS